MTTNTELLKRIIVGRVLLDRKKEIRACLLHVMLDQLGLTFADIT